MAAWEQIEHGMLVRGARWRALASWAKACPASARPGLWGHPYRHCHQGGHCHLLPLLLEYIPDGHHIGVVWPQVRLLDAQGALQQRAADVIAALQRGRSTAEACWQGRDERREEGSQDKVGAGAGPFLHSWRPQHLQAEDVLPLHLPPPAQELNSVPPLLLHPLQAHALRSGSRP